MIKTYSIIAKINIGQKVAKSGIPRKIVNCDGIDQRTANNGFLVDWKTANVSQGQYSVHCNAGERFVRISSLLVIFFDLPSLFKNFFFLKPKCMQLATPEPKIRTYIVSKDGKF